MSLTAALQFADSFDHYPAAQLPAKWTHAENYQFAAGRSGNAVNFPVGGQGQIFKTLPPGASQWAVGFAWKGSGLATGNQWVMYTYPSSANGYLPMQLMQAPDSTLIIVSGSKIAAFSNFPLAAGVWYYVEIAWQAVGGIGGPTTLNAVCSVNGKQIMSCTTFVSDAIVPAGGADTDTFVWPNVQNTFGAVSIDDVYISQPNAVSAADFYGDVKISPYYPTSDDAGNQWTGTHANIDSDPPVDSPGIHDATLGDKSFFGFQSITGYATAPGVQAVQSVIRGEGATNTEDVALLMGISTGFQQGTNIPLNPAGFQYYVQPWDQDLGPNPWTEARFNAEHWGIVEVTT